MVFDPAYLEKMTFGDQEQFNSILSRFTVDSQNDRLELLQCLQKNNINQVSLLLHRLAGRLAQIGCGDLGAAFRMMEIQVNESIEFEDALEPDQKERIVALCRDLERLVEQMVPERSPG
jgi:HPt (histidine-containing phosphotransfer) domain-containing protein